MIYENQIIFKKLVRSDNSIGQQNMIYIYIYIYIYVTHLILKSSENFPELCSGNAWIPNSSRVP